MAFHTHDFIYKFPFIASRKFTLRANILKTKVFKKTVTSESSFASSDVKDKSEAAVPRCSSKR